MKKTVKYLGIKVKLTQRYIAALKELCEAELEMMANTPGMHKELWTWGEVVLEDLECSDSLSFHFGREGDKPWKGRDKVRVVVK